MQQFRNGKIHEFEYRSENAIVGLGTWQAAPDIVGVVVAATNMAWSTIAWHHCKQIKLVYTVEDMTFSFIDQKVTEKNSPSTIQG